jgi:beta-galactosidase
VVMRPAPNAELSRSLARWLVPATAASAWSAGDTVSVATGTTPSGSRIVFLSNWSATPTTVTAPSAARDLVSGATWAAGDAVPLERRAALVLEVQDHSAE